MAIRLTALGGVGGEVTARGGPVISPMAIRLMILADVDATDVSARGGAVTNPLVAKLIVAVTALVSDGGEDPPGRGVVNARAASENDDVVFFVTTTVGAVLSKRIDLDGGSGFRGSGLGFRIMWPAILR